MGKRSKAMIFNFLGFAVLFIIARIALGYLLTLDRLYMALIAAVFASVLAPKFAVVDDGNGKMIVMKWIFIKGFRKF